MNRINDNETHKNMRQMGQQKTNRITVALIQIGQITARTKNRHKRKQR